MLKYIIKRVLKAIPMLLAVSIVIYALLQAMPGDPIDMYLENPSATPEAIEAIKKAYGLDQPVHIQYLNWLKGIVTGDWGRSFMSRRPVLELIGEKLAPTLQLSGTAFLIALVIAIPLGISGAIRKGKFFDNATSTMTFLGISMPAFWFGMMLQLLFAVQLQWLPTAGRTSLTGGDVGSFTDVLRHLIMPSIVLSLIYIASWARYARSNFIEVLNQDYIRTARAKGLREKTVYTVHALRNALLPIITVLGPTVAGLLTGSFVIETIFAIPGLGKWFVNGVSQRDYTTIMGITIFYAAFLMAMTLIVDIFYCLIDPRIKYES